MSAQVILACFAVGAAALALWWLVRFPRIGPHRATGALAAMGAAWAGMALARALFDALAGSGRYGVVAAMVLLVLPALTAAFWAAGCLLRALAAPLR